MKQKWHESKWKPRLDWETNSGRLLRNCVCALARDLSHPPSELIVFGSAPLQMGISPLFISGDVDIATREDVASVLAANAFGKGKSDPYIELSDPVVFVAATDWQARAHQEDVHGVTLIFPHPIDILVSKVNRCEEKDILAFQEVILKTGHPTEEELRASLQRVVDIYRPSFEEENGRSAKMNTELLWQRLFGTGINVPAEIIAPALATRRASYKSHGGFDAGRSLSALPLPGEAPKDTR